MCADLLESVSDVNLTENVLSSDEATFHSCGSINRYNSEFGQLSNLNQINEWKRDTPKVNACMGITITKIFGPFMFSAPTITANIYLDIMKFFFSRN